MSVLFSFIVQFYGICLLVFLSTFKMFYKYFTEKMNNVFYNTKILFCLNKKTTANIFLTVQ